MRISDWSSDVCSSDLNGSSARFVMGGRARRPLDIDLRTVGIVLEKNGEIVATASSGAVLGDPVRSVQMRSEEHTSELQSLMRTSYAVFCLKKKNSNTDDNACT